MPPAPISLASVPSNLGPTRAFSSWLGVENLEAGGLGSWGSGHAVTLLRDRDRVGGPQREAGAGKAHRRKAEGDANEAYRPLCWHDYLRCGFATLGRDGPAENNDGKGENKNESKR